MNNNTGLTTIEQVRKDYELMYKSEHTRSYVKMELKCWLYHSESRHKNGNPPFTYENYSHKLPATLIWEQIELNMIDVENLGGKEVAKEILRIE